MGRPATDVIDVWERLNLVDLTGDRRSTLVDHPDTQALSQLPYALVLEAAHLARQANHHGQLRLREWLNRAVALAADDADSPTPRRRSGRLEDAHGFPRTAPTPEKASPA